MSCYDELINHDQGDQMKVIHAQHNPSPNNWARADVWVDKDYIGCYSGMVDFYEVHAWAEHRAGNYADLVAQEVMSILDPTGKIQKALDATYC
jgi:hypothetical protein